MSAQHGGSGRASAGGHAGRRPQARRGTQAQARTPRSTGCFRKSNEVSACMPICCVLVEAEVCMTLVGSCTMRSMKRDRSKSMVVAARASAESAAGPRGRRGAPRTSAGGASAVLRSASRAVRRYACQLRAAAPPGARAAPALGESRAERHATLFAAAAAVATAALSLAARLTTGDAAPAAAACARGAAAATATHMRGLHLHRIPTGRPPRLLPAARAIRRLHARNTRRGGAHVRQPAAGGPPAGAGGR